MSTHPEDYGAQLESLRDKWLDYPFVVSIETYALCNAACNFCAYPELTRKGQKMPEPLFGKILDDLSDGRGHAPAAFNLSRVNEPFLDRRIFKLARRVIDRFPQSSLNFFSNASPLNQAKTEQLLATPNVASLNISLNDHRAPEYEKTMRLPFERTMHNIRRLHDLHRAGAVPFRVAISRVGDGSDADDQFCGWGRREFPRFDVYVAPRGDWMGLKPTTAFPVPKIGCAQWFKLHILADGREAYCCIDAEGRYGKGNAGMDNVLHIYNHPARRQMREFLPARKATALCVLCPLLA
jgi:hypothetical protein